MITVGRQWIRRFGGPGPDTTLGEVIGVDREEDVFFVEHDPYIGEGKEITAVKFIDALNDYDNHSPFSQKEENLIKRKNSI